MISKEISKAVIMQNTKFIDSKFFIESLRNRFIDLGGKIVVNKAEKIDTEVKKVILYDN